MPPSKTGCSFFSPVRKTACGLDIKVKVQGKYLDSRGQEKNLDTGLCSIHSRLLLPDVKPRPMSSGSVKDFTDPREDQVEEKEREVGDLVPRE